MVVAWGDGQVCAAVVKAGEEMAHRQRRGQVACACRVQYSAVQAAAGARRRACCGITLCW